MLRNKPRQGDRFILIITTYLLHIILLIRQLLTKEINILCQMIDLKIILLGSFIVYDQDCIHSNLLLFIAADCYTEIAVKYHG